MKRSWLILARFPSPSALRALKSHRRLPWVLASMTLAPGLSASARADTTIPISDIGTQVGSFNTHVTSVTYSDPQVVELPGFGETTQIRGTVSGVGWGGGGIVARANNAHYAHQVPWVARWRARGASKDLVIQHHGGSPPLVAVLQADRRTGAANPSRWAEDVSDSSAAVPALLNHCGYISANRRGLRGDGTFSATYLPSEAPLLTQAEVDLLRAAIAPGDASYQHPGFQAGLPVPLTLTNDAPTFRDIARALEQGVADVIGTRFRTRICSGHSSGARLGAAFNFGVSAIGAASVRTGGNHVDPYDPSSPRIFDGFILTGFNRDTATARADAEHPISAPVFFIQGRGDQWYQHSIRMAHELLEQGVPLNGSVWIYEVKGLTHVTRDIFETVQPSNGDRLGCFLSAAIRNMGELLRDGREPPVSRIAGRIQDGALVFDQAGGATTNVAPVREDPAIDTVQVDPMLTPRVIGAAETGHWHAVTAALEHESDAITPSTIACRLGGYTLKFFAAELRPFAPATLAAIYGSYEGYLACVEEVVSGLEAARLYDPRVESAKETAGLARALFGP